MTGVAVLFGTLSCTEATAPPNIQIIRVSGTPYERGLQQGLQMKSRIRSFYTQMLTASLLPFLNRSRPDVQTILTEYADRLYDDGRFSRLLMKDSALSLEAYIPEAYREELRGVAEGADVPYEDMLVLNTFIDSILGLRSVVFFIDRTRSPVIESFAVMTSTGADALRDHRDNDGDGEIDEIDEGTQTPYEPLPHATFAGVPINARFRFVLTDADGIDPNSVRIDLEGQVYTPSDPGMEVVELDAERLQATLTPTEPLPAAAEVSFLIFAGDKSVVDDPPPAHGRFMRDERIVVTTVGDDRLATAVDNRGVAGDRNTPTALMFGVRGTKSADGQLRMAHHFALLDNGTAHKHTAIVIHKPDDGPAFAVLTWAGIIGGMSGMNADGLVTAVNYSDTLNNSIAQRVKEDLFGAKLTGKGMPIGVMNREMLARFNDVKTATTWAHQQESTYGWNIMVGDKDRTLGGVEITSDILSTGERVSFVPQTRDTLGRRIASTSDDDLRAGVHFTAAPDDIEFELLSLRIRPQRYWSSYYLRSVRAFSILGSRIGDVAALDRASMIDILQDSDLIDQRDSMYAGVFEPELGLIHYAMGAVPATDEAFQTLDLKAEAQ